MSIPFVQSPLASDIWDAGGLGCGELVLELRGRLREMPGQVLRVIALDPGAPEDIPSWCRMTGNALVHQDPATSSYWIEARLLAGGAAEPKALSSPTSEVDEIYSSIVFDLANSLPPDSRLWHPMQRLRHGPNCADRPSKSISVWPRGG